MLSVSNSVLTISANVRYTHNELLISHNGGTVDNITPAQMSVTRNVSLSEREDSIVSRFARQSGIGVYSAALRVIINQWDVLTNHPQSAPQTQPSVNE